MNCQQKGRQAAGHVMVPVVGSAEEEHLAG